MEERAMAAGVNDNRATRSPIMPEQISAVDLFAQENDARVPHSFFACALLS
ncbi:hypothetical protein GQ55_3G288600 [Panicum hallii var. hallii]|uniref:Uncharacterized protein n=1 Tax=Panicum hallii var. hallii TaxID=1504633 RepID=A0A2T7EEF2_9POAL|nr:hypothetical protein GQ55_3G288600 [Panicum hallii var. hallii]